MRKRAGSRSPAEAASRIRNSNLCLAYPRSLSGPQRDPGIIRSRSFRVSGVNTSMFPTHSSLPPFGPIRRSRACATHIKLSRIVACRDYFVALLLWLSVLNFTDPLSSRQFVKERHNAIGQLKGAGHASSSGQNPKIPCASDATRQCEIRVEDKYPSQRRMFECPGCGGTITEWAGNRPTSTSPT